LVIQLGLIVLIGLWARSETGATNGPAVESKIRADRGLNFSHKRHLQKVKMDCTDCHGMGAAERSMPNHQLCSVCHETDEDAQQSQECSYCHARRARAVDALPKLLKDEIKFSHETHREKKCSDCHPRGEALKHRMPDDPSNRTNIPLMPTCVFCHPNPDKARFAAEPAMPFCVTCHQSMDDSRSECVVCHKTITRETHHPLRRGFE